MPTDPDRKSARERLLDATIEIVGTCGTDAVTYRAVARQAGVAHGLVRHHFGTRERLLAEAFRQAACSDALAIGLRVRSIDDFAKSFVHAMSESWKRPVMQLDEAIQAIRGALPTDNVIKQYDGYLHEIGKTLEAANIDDAGGRAAALVFAALDGVILQHFLYDDDERTEGVLALLRDLMRRMPTRAEVTAEASAER
ncbi:TetR/AcrR family transcriptional regulator [Amycolatopsis sp. NPDC004368]